MQWVKVSYQIQPELDYTFCIYKYMTSFLAILKLMICVNFPSQKHFLSYFGHSFNWIFVFQQFFNNRRVVIWLPNFCYTIKHIDRYTIIDWDR